MPKIELFKIKPSIELFVGCYVFDNNLTDSPASYFNILLQLVDRPEKGALVLPSRLKTIDSLLRALCASAVKKKVLRSILL